MKKYLTIRTLLIMYLLLGAANLSAQASGTENYISEKTCFDADCVKKAETVSYFDGLGRPKQTINIKASPTEKDVVDHFEYDAFGRQIKDYLPIPQQGTQNGAIYTAPLAYASNLYGTEKIYSENIPENSPLERLKQKIEIGNDWTTHPANYSYGANTAADAVKKFTVSTVWENNATKSTLSDSGVYAINQLYKNTNKDEDGYATTKFANSKGQVILSRQPVAAGETGEYVDTYYVYNEYDQLAFILPPRASASPTIGTHLINQRDLCYQYKYDSRYRMVEKKLPGKDWEYLVYDKQDRLVATQDANLRLLGRWVYTKYDQFGRVIMTGICQGQGTGTSRLEEQTYADTRGSNNELRSSAVVISYSGMDVYYSVNLGYPQYDKVVNFLSVNYYDTFPNYSFNPSFPTTIFSEPTLTQNEASENVSTKSLPLLSLMKNIENDNWTKKYNYYDKKGRVIATHTINHLGGYTRVENELDFTGLAKQTKTFHKRLASETEVVIKEDFEYDNLNRQKKHWHQVNSLPQELLSDNTFDERSLLSNQKVGNNLQSIDYQYDVRGWASKINDPADLGGKLFGYQIKYHNPSTVLGIQEPRYNGNISEVDWKVASDGVLKRYTYKYDGLNRLIYGKSYKPNLTTPNIDYYENLTYDYNGNIIALSRGAISSASPTVSQQFDDLYYSYQGNRVASIADQSGNLTGYVGGSGQPISYDANGNMTSFPDQKIGGITYNFLNLPSNVKLLSSGRDKPNTDYTYRADGVKLAKKFVLGPTTISTDYLDGFQYEKNSLQPSAADLKFVSTGDGYFSFENNKYIYQYKDQVGNIRVSYYKDGAGNAAIDDTTDFYPFGLEHPGKNLGTSITPSYRYGFQKQEKQQETGWSSFKWRNYDPTIGRFFNVDPLSEKYAYQSHYNFSENRVTDARELEGLEGQKIKGFLFTMADNVMGTDFRNKYRVNSAEYRDGVVKGHGLTLVLTALMAVDGAASVGGGTGGLAVAGGASATGVGAPGGAALGVVSAGAIAKGTIELLGAGVILKHTIDNVKSDNEAKRPDGPYSQLKDHKSVGPGKPFTRSQKKNILKENMKKNGGVIKSDMSGEILDMPTQSKKGEKANMNQAEIDHINPRSKGNTNSHKNAQVLSKKENLQKLDN
jgi:RHS repeat-associated protein